MLSTTNKLYHITLTTFLQYLLLQETQLSLTNRATHLCKYNNMADLTSVINKIRLKKIDSSYPAFQGHSRSSEPTRIDAPPMTSY